MVSGVLALGGALGLSVLSNVEVGSAFGGGKVFGGKGARYTNVVARTPIMQPMFAQPLMAAPFGNDSIMSDLRNPIVGRSTPFHGARAAVSGDVIGVAPEVAPLASNMHNTAAAYGGSGSMLGESLGLVPVGLGDGGFNRSGSLLNSPLISNLNYPGFPAFENDGYIIHDQRGRDASTCPPGGCGEAGAMSGEMQAMYDKYKRYYRSFGSHSRAAPAPGRLIDPLPIGQYSRVNSGLAGGGSHFVASPMLDSLSNRLPGGRMPAAVQHYARAPAANYAQMEELARMRGGTDRAALGGSVTQPRDSFFGKIYDSPDHMGEDPTIDHELIYDGTRPSMPSPYATQFYGAPQGVNR